MKFYIAILHFFYNEIFNNAIFIVKNFTVKFFWFLLLKNKIVKKVKL